MASTIAGPGGVSPSWARRRASSVSIPALYRASPAKSRKLGSGSSVTGWKSCSCSSSNTPGSSALVSGYTAVSAVSSNNPWNSGSSSGTSSVHSNGSPRLFRNRNVRPCFSRVPIAFTRCITWSGIGMGVKERRFMIRPVVMQ